MNEAFKILIVDDEEDYCDVIAMILQTEGYDVKKCNKPKEVVDILKSEEFDLILSDLIMPELDGIALLEAVKKLRPSIYFIIMTAFGTIENAVKAMKYGAFTYVIKGSDPEEFLKEIGHIRKLKLNQDKSEASKVDQQGSEFMMSTKNAQFRDMLAMTEKAAKSDVNILILGESGVGKEVIAQYIHVKSNRSHRQFLPTNCHTFSDSLLESELFGHEKGSFTGALTTRIGRFEAADEGTLFLDEIGDVPLSTQAKLLRAIETKKINRIGKNEEITVDFRLVSATNKDLDQAIKEGSFRMDLFYRLSTVILEVPPLRQRKEDLPDLISYFLKKSQKTLGLDEININANVMEILMNYHYPGNIRELKNIIERMVVLSDNGIIKAECLSNLEPKSGLEDWDLFLGGTYSLRELRKEVESKYIAKLLKKNMQSISKTALDLDISTRQLFNKITEYGIKDGNIKGASDDEE